MEKIIFDSHLNFYKYLSEYSFICLISGSEKEEINIAATLYKSIKQKCKCSIKSVNIPSSDMSKSFYVVQTLLCALHNFNVDRKSVIVSVGGGAISDCVGFVASIYMRGVDFIEVPTTLLSMIDAGIGGKRAVNFMNVKNLIGSFYMAKKVLIDISFLSTLSICEAKSGLCELAKMSFVCQGDLYNKILNAKNNFFCRSNINLDIIKPLIEKAIILKQDVVKSDFHDTNGRRAKLNYGHTLAHAIELSYCHYIPHGFAVAIGMDFAAFVSKILNIQTANLEKTQLLCFKAFDCYKELIQYRDKITSIPTEIIAKNVLSDKKVYEQKINFIVLKSLSNVQYLTINISDFKKFLDMYIKSLNS